VWLNRVRMPAGHSASRNGHKRCWCTLGMEASLRNSTLSAMEVESIKLLVSEINQCDYCLAIHTMKSRKAGIDKETQIAIRSERATGSARVDALLAIVRAFLFHKKFTVVVILPKTARKIYHGHS